MSMRFWAELGRPLSQMNQRGSRALVRGASHSIFLCISLLIAGCGTPSAVLSAPLAVLSAMALNLPSTTVGAVGATVTVTLSNSGGETLLLDSYVLKDTANFTVTTTCGASVAANASCTFAVQLHPQSVGTLNTTLTITDNSGGVKGTQQVVALSGTGVAVPVPQAALAPVSLTFPQTVIHSAASDQIVTLTNPGTAPLEISGTSVSDPADFTVNSTCGSALAPNASCTFSIAFHPQTVAPLQAVLTVTDNSSGSSGAQQTVRLNGTGLPMPMAQVSIAPTSLLFAASVLNTTSPAQLIKVSNTGTAPLAIAGTTLADTVNYSLSSACGTALAAGANCALAVTFHPQTTGPLPSTLTLVDNSGVASGTVQQVIALNGTGLPIPLPQAKVAPNTATFDPVNIGSVSPPQTFTVTNTGTALLSIGSIILSDPADYSLANTCPGTLAPAATCTFTVVFRPQTPGVLPGNITVSDNSGGSANAQQVVALSGTGVALPAPQAALTPSALTFPDTMVTRVATAQTITLSNTGNATLNLAGAVLSDTQNFNLSSSCGATLVPNASCSLAVSFQPGTAAPFGATLTLTDNSGNSGATVQQAIPITGRGTPFMGPIVALSATSLSFPQTVTNSHSAPQTVTLTNTGTTPLTISGVALGGTGATAFALSSGTCTGTLPAGATCTEAITYAPLLASTADTASLVFTDDSLGRAGAMQTLTLTGSALARVDSVTNFGDSLTCGNYAQPHDGTGYVWSLEGYAGLFDTYLGVPSQNFCRGGDTAADLARLSTLFSTSSTSAGNQLYTVMIGTNDAYLYGIPQNSLQAYTAEVGAALSWLAIPNPDKVLANTMTQQTGRWSPDVDFGMMSSDAGAALTFSVNQNVAGRNLYVVYHVWALPYGQAGKATVSVDGVVQATVEESQNSLVNIPTQNGTFDTFLVQTVPLGAVGQHTIAFSSAGPAGSKVGLMWAAVAQQDYRAVDGAPRVLIGLIPNSPSGNQTFAADTYNLQLKTLVPAMVADGMNLTIVPTDRLLDGNTDFADNLHPNNEGHAKIAAAFEHYR